MATAPQAARSIHLWYAAPEANCFYSEVTIEQSTLGSYFMACGFKGGSVSCDLRTIVRLAANRDCFSARRRQRETITFAAEMPKLDNSMATQAERRYAETTGPVDRLAAWSDAPGWRRIVGITGV